MRQSISDTRAALTTYRRLYPAGLAQATEEKRAYVDQLIERTTFQYGLFLEKARRRGLRVPKWHGVDLHWDGARWTRLREGDAAQ